MKELLEDFFERSRKQKGFLYLCERNQVFRNMRTNKIFKEHKFKYGKTKNIEKRMQMYGSEYSMLKNYRVNHLSLRENLIRNHWDIEEDRRYKDARDEHVDFDCSDIVKQYAECDIKLIKYGIDNFRLHCYDKGSTDYFYSTSIGILIDSFHL